MAILVKFIIYFTSSFVCIYRGVFKRSAAKIVAGLDKDIFSVEIAKKKGSFVVKLDVVDKPIIELVGLVRPFTKLRELDLDKVVDKIKKA